MDRQSVERLRFDRRLKSRNGWVDVTTEDEYLSSLPDVSDKMTTCGAEEDVTEVVSEEAPVQPQPELEPQTPAPVAGDFSAQRAYSSDPTPASSDTSAADALPDQGSAGTFRSEGGFGGDSNSN